MKLPNGKVLKLTHLNQNYLSYELHWKGWSYYEPIYMLLFREILQDQDVFIDIGGNMGYYALSAAGYRPDLPIHAFEPNPKMNGILTANINANGFTNITLNELALSDKEGTQTFYLPASDLSGTLDPEFNAGEEVTKQEVQTSTLDAYLNKHSVSGRVLIKVDVEGHEPEVLEGAKETLTQHKPDIIMEVTNDYGEDLLKLLADLGYGIYDLTLNGFEKCESLEVHKEDGHFFLNRYVTTRNVEDLKEIFNRIQDQFRTFNLDHTNLARPNEC